MDNILFNPVIVYRVTDFCNLNCVFCAHARELVRPRNQANPQDVLDFGNVLAAYREKTGNRVLVNWLGGEPLSWKPLAKMSEEYKHLGIDLSATTNGVPLNSPEMRAHIIKNYTQLTISVDGFASFHDKKRGMSGLFALVEKAVTALSKERDRAGSNLHLRINTVLMCENFSQFPELCKTFASWGINEITYNQLGGRDRPENFAELRLQPEHIDSLEKLLPSLKVYMESKGVFINTNPNYITRFKAYARDESIYVENCNPGQNFLFIDEHSRIAPCNFTVDDYGISVREITSVRKLEDLPARFAAKQKANHSYACHNCMSTQVSGKFDPNP